MTTKKTKRIVCPICGRKFNYQYTYYDHLIEHDDRGELERFDSTQF